MTSKTLNIIMVVCLILFAGIFGISMAIKNSELAKLDSAYEEQLKENIEKENESILDDLNTQNKNEQNNNINSTTNSGNGNNNTSNGGVVNFSDFVSMYTYAENKLNNATSVHSIGSGTGILNGPTSIGGIKLNNEKINMDFVRAQNASQKYFTYNFAGNLLDGLFKLDYRTSVYSEGAIYHIFFNQDNTNWQSISKAAVNDKFAWNTNQTFHVINENSVKSSSCVYDKYSKTYTGVAELEVAVSSERSKQTLMGVMDASAPATYINSKITVVVDQFGNFKSIRYQETFKINVYNSAYKATMYATINADYTETFKIIGNGNVNITRPNI